MYPNKPTIITIGTIILIAVTVIFSLVRLQAQSPTISFDFPLGDDTYNYGPILQYYGNPPTIVEDTRYGIKNPDLGSEIKCFGQPWDQLYHAGEDWYRFDKSTGKILDTAGAIVKAVGNGKVVHRSTPMYPGVAVIVEHILSPPRNGHTKIYSVYMHLQEVFVSEGTVVNKGYPIGTVRAASWSGVNPDPNRPAYDSHLHWEMRYFFDGSNIYSHAPDCNDPGRVIAGRGYTYPQYPDDFPADSPYVNPSAFIGYNASYPVGDKVYLPLIRRDPTPTPTPTPTVTPTPTRTPTPTPRPCLQGQDIIVNGDLENTAQHALWAQNDGDPNRNWPLIDDEKPYQGVYGIWMGGRNNAKEEIYQTIDLPLTIKQVDIEFRLYVQTDELTNDDYDFLYWDLKSETTGRSLLQHPVTFTNRYTPHNQWVLQTLSFTQLQSLTEHRVRLSIRDTTNGSRVTSFFIDNIKFKTRCSN